MGDAILRTHGKTYEVGQSRDVVGYAAGGTTEDYAYHPDNGLDIPYAWVYELRFDLLSRGPSFFQGRSLNKSYCSKIKLFLSSWNKYNFDKFD